MIFGHIDVTPSWPLPAVVKKALQFLKHTDFQALPAGKVDIDGDKMFAQVLDLTTCDLPQLQPESHRRYVDVQYLVSGEEKIGVTPDVGNYQVAESKLEQHDIQFYQSVADETFLDMVPGNYAVFFPEDIHRPACHKHGLSNIRKVVVKIALSEFI
ncbi:YhcH/YjgK/YiaL family protein [Rosenbergiella collisarenosi]|uniref:YhcH/YjgK/YiaL family protein n=1 Tax=Rosenbergiella collisarenosi TaxID=1544695 RepID=UPI001F4ED5F4|nr:YhcH/YjgK/YiaL family protein [Rosenbergiella collisarenosi]